MASEPETPARPDTPWGSLPERSTDLTPAQEKARKDARRRVEAKRGWMAGFVSYVVVNAFLVGVWAMTGFGYFWPGWVLGGWGIGVAMSYYAIYVKRPVTEDDVDEELRRRHR